MRCRITVDGEVHDLEIEDRADGLIIRVDGAAYRTRVSREAGSFLIRVGGRRHRVAFLGGRVEVDGADHEVSTETVEGPDRPLAEERGLRGASVLEVRPPMPGRVVKVLVAAGADVKRGQTLAVLEAMKMQNEVPAPASGTVRSVGVQEGETIAGDRVIAVIEAR